VSETSPRATALRSQIGAAWLTRNVLVPLAAVAIFWFVGATFNPSGHAVAMVGTGLLVLSAIGVQARPLRLVCVAALGLTLPFAIVEVALYYGPRQGAAYYSSARLQTELDELGSRPIPQALTVSKYTADRERIYEATYSIDANRLRVTPGGSAERDGTVLFFGGSFVFGEGVDEDQTTPYYFSKFTDHRYRVLNFGFQGYGTHQMLRTLELGLPDPLIEGRVVRAIYMMIEDHVRRVSGETFWSQWDPQYRMAEDGGVQFVGRFLEPDQWLRRALRRSQIARRTVTLWQRPEHEKLELTRRVIVRSDRLLRDRFGARLEVFFWNRDSNRSRELVEMLREDGFDLFLASDVLLGTSWDGSLLPGDGHPTALAHRHIGRALAGSSLSQVAR